MQFGIHFGLMSPTIASQLKKQGFKYSKEEVKLFQKMSDALGMLTVHSVLGEREREKANHRLYMQVRKHVMKVNKLKPAPQKKANAN